MDSCSCNLNIAPYCILFLYLAFSCHQASVFCLGDELRSTMKSCVEEERQALLSFKQHLVDPSGKLSSWEGQDCCLWKGIVCNNRNGHVTKINLRNRYEGVRFLGRSRLLSMAPVDEEEWDEESYEQSSNSSLGGKINSSLLGLKYLYYLDLSWNHFEGIPIPNFFGQLKSLKYLNLSSSSFGGEVPPSLRNLSNLNHLDLSWNGNLKIPSRNLNWLSHLSSLKSLNLGGLNLGSIGVNWLQNVNMLPSLSVLRLCACQIENLPLSLEASNFTDLLILDFSQNSIGSSFPRWFFNLTSLRKLDLSYNYFSGPISSEFSNLKYLEGLDLSFNDLEGQLPEFIGTLCKLKTLSLAGNTFGGSIQELLSGFSKCIDTGLESLDLSYNRLESKLPASLGMLVKLQNLNLGFNKFRGSIPECVRNLSSLKTLSLSYTLMSGSIPESLGQLHKLVQLDLSWNSWEGILTEAHFSNLTRLEYIAIGATRDQPMTLMFKMAADWIPPFKLHKVTIFNCQVGPSFPRWLKSQTELSDVTLRKTGISDSISDDWFLKISPQVTKLDLSYNQIHGKLTFQVKFPKLQSIDLSHNQLEGPLPLWSTNASVLNLESNLFSGPIPSDFDQLFPQLQELYLSENPLSGTIPPCICNMQSLSILSLRSNQLSGEFPQTWSLCHGISVLDVADNNLSGSVPSSMGLFSSLAILNLNNNNFGGKIPSSLQNCSFLSSIDLGDNGFIGDIPLWIGSKLSELYILRLRSNFFQGEIPQQLCNLSRLQILDLAQNNFTGTIPKCLNNITSLVSLDSDSTFLAYNQQTTVTSKGMELRYNTTLFWVKSIDLSLNNLEGEIPEEICSLIGLGTLNLSRNQLSGSMPLKIGNLRWLETLDLSHNHLSGQIPQSLSSLTSLSHLNLSYNNLAGRIPQGNQLQTLDNFSIYEGNPSLCGVPLSTKCPGDSSPASSTNHDNDAEDSTHSSNEDGSGVFWLYVSIILGFVLGFWGVCGTLIVKKSWRYAYFQFFDDIKDKIALAIALKVACLQRKT